MTENITDIKDSIFKVATEVIGELTDYIKEYINAMVNTLGYLPVQVGLILLKRFSPVEIGVMEWKQPFIICVIVASKCMYEHDVSMEKYARIVNRNSQVLKRMELELLKTLDYRVHVDVLEYKSYFANMKLDPRLDIGYESSTPRYILDEQPDQDHISGDHVHRSPASLSVADSLQVRNLTVEDS